ncbi:MAG TPA: PilZ domain-containing protein [Telluria sp.]
MRSDQRNASRKILKVKALLNVDGMETQRVRTLDVGSDGVCLVTDNAIKVGAAATVHFEIFHDGKLQPITARSKVQYCILSNEGFKVGFQFVNVELQALATLSKFLH